MVSFRRRRPTKTARFPYLSQCAAATISGLDHAPARIETVLLLPEITSGSLKGPAQAESVVKRIIDAPTIKRKTSPERLAVLKQELPADPRDCIVIGSFGYTLPLRRLSPDAG